MYGFLQGLKGLAGRRQLLRRHIATGDALFTQYQPIYNPRINWVGNQARQIGIYWWPASPTAPCFETALCTPVG